MFVGRDRLVKKVVVGLGGSVVLRPIRRARLDERPGQCVAF